MKTIILTILLFFATGLAGFAQIDSTTDEPRTLFSSGSRVTGWFIQFDNSYTTLNGQHTYMPGFAGGIVINRNFRIGLMGKSLSWYPTYLKYDNVMEEPVYLEGGHGGLYMVASPIENKAIHITFPLLLGAGGAVYTSQQEYLDLEELDEIDYHHFELSSSPYFMIEPGANVEVSVTGFMKLYAGYSYRWLMGLNLANTSSNALNGSSFNFGVKFGKF